MTGVSERRQQMWTAGEVGRAIAWRSGGMTILEIATLLRRSRSSVDHQVRKAGCLPPCREAQPVIEGDFDRAKRLLALEIVRARAERATAPLLRSWPAGVWP
jgi:uncharacterized protein YjlB